jgi:glycosyltransferase involved in cell wall biosynthesis
MSRKRGTERRRLRGARTVDGPSTATTRTRGLVSVPRLTIGLPVYNGESTIEEALDALLGQTYQNFELIVSDNASTDRTADICRRYAEQDSRIRYVRQEHNIGLVSNHIFLMEQARGELFKWASHDDLYARDLLARCVEALDEDPDVVLAHSWSAMIDGSGDVIGTFERRVAVDSPRAPDRFRSMLFDGWDDHAYGVIRTRALRRMTRRGSYHFADRTLNTELSLHGRFHLVPDWLYFRREHTGRPPLTVRERCAILDPRRADRLRHPVVRLYGEYLWGYVAAIRQAPLSTADRRECYGHLARWIGSRALPVVDRALRRERLREEPLSGARPLAPVDAVVAGRDRSSARDPAAHGQS